MQLSQLPAKFSSAFASGAASPYIRTIPATPTGTPGQASLQSGFPPENFSPVAAGGVPPFGADFNGLFNQSTGWNLWSSAGMAFPPYDPTFQTAIGGYPKGVIVASLVAPLLFYYCLVDNNVTNPDLGGAGWFIFYRQQNANTDVYVNTSTGNDNNNGLTPTTATKTIQAAVNIAWTFPPSQYVVTVHIADGSYNENVTVPLRPGPPLIITGNASTPSNVVVNGSAGSTFFVQGPNTATIQNLEFTNSNASASGIEATSGAVVTTANTVSGSVAASAFLGNGSGTLTVGSHVFTANVAFPFAAERGGALVLGAGATYTISNAITVTNFAIADANGSVEVPGSSVPTFVNPGNVTGLRYIAELNGVINTQGAGINYFPGTVAGQTQTGGQYA